MPPQKDVGTAGGHGPGIAAVQHPRHVRVLAIELPGPGGGELEAHRGEVGVFVPDEAVPGVDEEASQPKDTLWHPVEKIHGFGAVVGGGDGGEGGCPVSAAQGGEETPGVQPALGVGDEVELFAACLGKDLLYPPGQGFGVFLHRGPAVLTAEVNLGSVLL